MALALVTTSALLTGCAAASPAAPPSASASPTVPYPSTAPTGTQTMSDLGWTHAPARRIVLPLGANIDVRVDQPNVITAVGNPAMSQLVLTTLTDTLPSYGWTITASGGGSLLFTDGSYDGAFTSDSTTWALTVRAKA